jgi:hypothetical protein
MAKVAVNGLGRIGRATLKIVLGRYSNQLVREALRIARRDGWQRNRFRRYGSDQHAAQSGP